MLESFEMKFAGDESGGTLIANYSLLMEVDDLFPAVVIPWIFIQFLIKGIKLMKPWRMHSKKRKKRKPGNWR